MGNKGNKSNNKSKETQTMTAGEILDKLENIFILTI